MIRNRVFLAGCLVALLCCSIMWMASGTAVASAGLPKSIHDDAFWQMISDFSEPGGSFPYDNFISNETLFQHVIPDLLKTTKPGGVYFGVGPEQNFTYIAALQPRIAFIIDIRRQNMIEQLMHKALIEISANRSEYLSYLFSRKRPSNAGSDSTPDALFQAYNRVSPDRKLFEENLKTIEARLIGYHGFKLSDDDKKSLETSYEAFFTAGPTLTYYGFKPPIPQLILPNFEDLMTQTDGQGVNRSYLASEKTFRVVKNLEKNNLIVPVVGDFAGPKAVRAAGQYVKDHGATVTTVYLSNVEQYLFNANDDWKNYYSSVATLPLDSSSTFIRSFNRIPAPCPKCSVISLLCPIDGFMKAFNAGQIARYSDVIGMSK